MTSLGGHPLVTVTFAQNSDGVQIPLVPEGLGCCLSQPARLRSLASWQIPGLLVVFLVVAVVMTTSIDPSEEQVRRKVRRGRRLRPVFDRSVHEHVIENRHCNLCQVDV